MGRRWDGHEWTPVDEPFRTRVHAALMGPDGAPPVVLVHGLGCSHRYYWPLARALAPHARVAAVDLPGFGLTRGPRPAPDVRHTSTALAAWLRASGREGAVIVANSLGCHIVLDLAGHAPQLLGPVVLNAPAVDRLHPSWRRHAWRLLRDVPVERWSVWPVIARDVLAAGPVRVLRTFGDVLRDPVEHKAAEFPNETVVLRGTRDPLAPREWSEHLVAALPRGRLAEVAGAGHVLQWSHPHEFAAVVRRLLPARV